MRKERRINCPFHGARALRLFGLAHILAKLVDISLAYNAHNVI
jgi:hypothetical protein